MPSIKENLRRALQTVMSRDKAKQIADRTSGEKAAQLLSRMEN